MFKVRRRKTPPPQPEPEDEKIDVPPKASPILEEKVDTETNVKTVPSRKKVAEKKVRTRKPNAWVQHVRDIAKKEGITYKQAMSKAKSTYKK